MKKISNLCVLLLLVVCGAKAQTPSEQMSRGGGWRYAFSEEGRKAWKPEFTARYSACFYTFEPAVTGGVRIDDKRTLGLMVSVGDCGSNEIGWADKVYTGLYFRRYFHPGGRDVVAFYGDLTLGAVYTYGASEGIHGEAAYARGEIGPALSLQPGIRFRCWRNVHLFFGPTLMSTMGSATFGLHAGIGF